MPRPYRGPKRVQIIAYVPPAVKKYIRYVAAKNEGGSETEFISRILTAEFNAQLALGDPLAMLAAEAGDGQNLEEG